MQKYLTQHGYHKQSHHSIRDLSELIALHLMFPKLIYLAPGQVSLHCTIFFCVIIPTEPQLHRGLMLKTMSKMPFRVNVSVHSISHRRRQYSLSPCIEVEGTISSYHLCKPSKLSTAQDFQLGLVKNLALVVFVLMESAMKPSVTEIAFKVFIMRTKV